MIDRRYVLMFPTKHRQKLHRQTYNPIAGRRSACGIRKRSAALLINLRRDILSSIKSRSILVEVSRMIRSSLEYYACMLSNLYSIDSGPLSVGSTFC